MGHQEEVDIIKNESKNKPWQSAGSFSPEPGEKYCEIEIEILIPNI